MTIENWVTIALIITSFIAQLIAPTLAELVKSRINQPKPTPVPNQPKNLSQRIGGWVMHIGASPWVLPPLVILLDIWFLFREFRNAAPVTRSGVLLISTAVAGAFFTLMNMNFIAISQMDRTLSHEQATSVLGIIGKMTDTILVLDTRLKVAEASATTQIVASPVRDTAAQVTPNKLLVAIKKLYGGSLSLCEDGLEERPVTLPVFWADR